MRYLPFPAFPPENGPRTALPAFQEGGGGEGGVGHRESATEWPTGGAKKTSIVGISSVRGLWMLILDDDTSTTHPLLAVVLTTWAQDIS